MKLKKTLPVAAFPVNLYFDRNRQNMTSFLADPAPNTNMFFLNMFGIDAEREMCKVWYRYVLLIWRYSRGHGVGSFWSLRLCGVGCFIFYFFSQIVSFRPDSHYFIFLMKFGAR